MDPSIVSRFQRQGTGYQSLDEHDSVTERNESIGVPRTALSTTNAIMFNSRTQASSIFWRQTIRWLTTMAFLATSLITLRVYQRMGNVSFVHKATFNSIITALILLLGLNYFEAFKEVAKVLRWSILAQGKHNIREVDLILGIEGLSNVVTLGWESRAKPLTFFLCTMWILMNVLAQASVALLSLTYSYDDGRGYNDTFIVNGTVSVANLKCYFDPASGVCPSEIVDGTWVDSQAVHQGFAHAYGEGTPGTGCGQYNDNTDILNSKFDFPYFCRMTRNSQEFAYRFSEFNPNDTQRTYPHFTYRIITASAGQCFQYKDSGNTTIVKDPNGFPSAFNYTFYNDTYTNSITIPIGSGAKRATTYIYRGFNIPEEATTFSCGPRCIWMWAHRERSALPDAQKPPESQLSAFYQCPITVSKVFNTSDHSIYAISDDLARLAAAAIGLEGRYANDSDGTTNWEQYQFIPFGNPLDAHNKSMAEVGALMAEFAIRSLATMVRVNPQITTNGSLPVLGSLLRVHWPYVIALSAWILGTQAVIFAVVVRTAHTVVVKDDSELSTARLLRPLVEALGASGTLSTGKAMSQVLYKDNLVYGPRETNGSNEFTLEISEDVLPLEALFQRRHPDGRYQ